MFYLFFLDMALCLIRSILRWEKLGVEDFFIYFLRSLTSLLISRIAQNMNAMFYTYVFPPPMKRLKYADE